MLAIAAHPRLSGATPEPLRLARRPLAAVERELASLCHRIASLSVQAGRAGRTWRPTLQQLRVHLFLTASQLLPVWRDMCRDSRPVDRAQVRLSQLDALAEQTLQAGEDDPMAEARCAVLAEALQEHQVRSAVLLRALDAVVEADSLQALAEVWVHEGERLRRAQAQGRPVVLDNEDLDPVGQPPR